MIYLDNAATTPVYAKVRETMDYYHSKWFFNPSATYSHATEIKNKINEAREILASYLNADADEIYFTSGGTEGDNYAINYGVRKNGYIISQKTEHKAILEPLFEYQKNGGRMYLAKVDSSGKVVIDDIRRHLARNTALISIMYANNEIGTIQPIDAIGHMAKEYDVTFHTDAVQAFGHLNIDVKKQNIDMLSASSHKFGGPKGAGFIYIEKNVEKKPFIFGGGQEYGVRSGTENVPGIIGMSVAAEISYSNLLKKNEHCRKICDYIKRKILNDIPCAKLTGAEEEKNRLSNNVSFVFEGVDAQSLLVYLDLNGICASAGSACHGKSKSYSHVLQAIGVSRNYIGGALRMTVDHTISFENAKYVVAKIEEIVDNISKKRSNL